MRNAILALLLVLAASTASACKERPTFNLDWMNWQATHVVLARVDTKTEKLEVLESWRGDLARGTRVAIDRLATLDADDYCVVLLNGHPTRHRLSGERGVFFLTRSGDRLAPTTWLPISHVWLEDGKSYAYAIGARDGVTELGVEETALHASVVTAGELRGRFDRANATADTGSRALALVGLSLETEGWIKNVVEGGFSTCPREAARVLDGLLAKRSLLETHAEILSWVQRLDAERGATASRAVIQDELARWKRIAPTFARRNGEVLGEAEKRELDAHLARLATAVGFVHGDGKAPELDELRGLFSRPELSADAAGVLLALDPPARQGCNGK